MQFPRFAEVRQKLYAKRIDDLAAAIRGAWGQSGCRRCIRKGDRVGIAVGSRGIDNIAAIVRLLAELIEEAGGRPFVLPAMGSHGGATPEGQTAVLASLGVTPESVGAPIRASMAITRLGQTRNGIPVYTAREAARADGIIVVNRIKQHTDFSGPYESGLVKMLAIGLGKREGAAAMHSRGCMSLREDVPEAARLVVKRVPLVGGIAILENGYHQTADVIGMPAGSILSQEIQLLRRQRRTAARLPFREIDLLLVDWIGKDISGVGFDTHVIGRRMIWGEPEFRGARIRLLAALDLTPGSHGNGLGCGLADLVTERLARKIDWTVVRTNVLHTGFLNRAKLPLTLPNDRELIAAALTALGSPDPGTVRVVRIADTLQLGRMWVSEALLREARRRSSLRVVDTPTDLRFDRSGHLRRLPAGGGPGA